MRTFVLDIETYKAVDPRMRDYLIDRIKPDSRMKDPAKIEADIQAKAAAIDEKAALSPLTGKIVAIGVLEIGENAKAWARAGQDEAAIISEALDQFPVDGPFCLVTYNGQRFDLPYLMARTALHSMGRLQMRWPHPRGKYHVDLYDILGNGRLEEWALLLLGRGKTSGGNEIEGMVEQGNWDGVRQHVTEDVVMTAQIYKRLDGVAILERY